MRVGGVQLNAFQTNFIKELMGDLYMTDTRAEATLGKICHKYDVDASALLVVANERWAVKNAEFKRLEAEDLARA